MTPKIKALIIIVLFVALSAWLVGACGRKGEPQTPAEAAEPAE